MSGTGPPLLEVCVPQQAGRLCVWGGAAAVGSGGPHLRTGGLADHLSKKILLFLLELDERRRVRMLK